jgi:hypothetical protein
VKQIRKRITYANVMSSIAVFMVLGGATAIAASKIGTNQLKANAVTASKIKKNAVTTAKIKNNAVNGSKVKDGSLTGADVDLGTLGTVPSANRANSAAKSDQVAKIFYTANEGPGTQTILSLGGLTITALCAEGGSVQLEATTSVAHAWIDFFTPQDHDYDVDEDFNPGETFDADDGHDQGTFTDIYSLSYNQPGGTNVTVEIRDVDPEVEPVFPGTSAQAECFVGGFAIAG